MHLKLLQANSVGVQVGYVEEQDFFSSDPSPQSLSRSHFQTEFIQRPLSQRYWSSEQGWGGGQLFRVVFSSLFSWVLH